MKWEEFSRILEQTKKRRPIWFQLESDPPCEFADVQLLEKTLFIELPGEYKTFLQAFGGGYFAFVIVFSATKGSEWNLVAQNEQAGVLEKYSFLAISDNEAGDYYGFKVEDGVCDSKISFFDHEDGSVKETKYENLFEYLIKEGLTIK